MGRETANSPQHETWKVALEHTTSGRGAGTGMPFLTPFPRLSPRGEGGRDCPGIELTFSLRTRSPRLRAG